MRLRNVFIALALAACGVVVSPTPAVRAAGSPPACTISNNSQQQCSRDATARAKGSIGLVGDSVMLGSANGMSNPGLPAMLASAGWGPVSFAATLGMTTRNNSNTNVSAWHWIDKWQKAGWYPDVIAINVGANQLGTCTPGNTAACESRINALLDKIPPTTRVWWALINHQNYPSGSYSSGMLGWNGALTKIAGQRANLFLWDWPYALATANPAITMGDVGRVHPASAAQYVKRSTLMAADIDHHLGPATFDGALVTTPPATVGDPLRWVAGTPTLVVNTSIGLNGSRLGGGEQREITLDSLAPADATAVVVSAGAYAPDANGYLTVYPCGDPPLASNVNFEAGGWRAAQAITLLSAERSICVTSNTATDIFLSVQGWFVDGPGSGFRTTVPERLLDTRQSGRHQLLTVTVPGGADTAAVTLTATQAAAAGRLTAYACDQPLPGVTTLTFGVGETVAGAAYVPVAADGTICVDVWTNTYASTGELTDVIVDLTGTFDTEATLSFQPAEVKRMLDTRTWVGGWKSRQAAGQTIDVAPAPDGAAAVTGTLTMVQPTSGGYIAGAPCGAPPPPQPTSTVNAEGGYTLANSLTVGLGDAGKLCVLASVHTHTIFDVAGWWLDAV